MIYRLSHWKRSVRHLLMTILVAIIPLTGFSVSPMQAKAPAQIQPATLIIDGIVLSITGEIWIVSGVSIDVTAQTVITGYPVIGSTVHIIQSLMETIILRRNRLYLFQ